MWLLLALLLLLRSPLAEGASNFHLRNHTGLLFLYDFTEGQRSEEVPTHARDITGRYLMGNLTTSPTAASWSASQQGMRIPSISGGVRAESQLSSASLLTQLTSEFTLELFFSSPNNPLSQSLLIAGFGDWPPGAPFARCDATNTVSEGGWRISSSLGSVIEVEVVMLVSGAPVCISSTVSISTNSLRHFVIRARSGVLSIVSHGSFSSTMSSNPMFSPSLWARHAAPLTIANPHATTGWTGTMYMVAMYDRYLSDAEIAANQDFGPPNSLPTTLPSLSIPEDSTTTLYP